VFPKQKLATAHK